MRTGVLWTRNVSFSSATVLRRAFLCSRVSHLLHTHVPMPRPFFMRLFCFFYTCPDMFLGASLCSRVSYLSLYTPPHVPIRLFSVQTPLPHTSREEVALIGMSWYRVPPDEDDEGGRGMIMSQTSEPPVEVTFTFGLQPRMVQTTATSSLNRERRIISTLGNCRFSLLAKKSTIGPTIPQITNDA